MTTVGGTDGPPGAVPGGRVERDGSWTTWFERSLGLVFAIVVVNDVVISGDYIGATVAASSPPGQVAVLAGTATLLASAAIVTTTGRRDPNDATGPAAALQFERHPTT